MRAILVLSLALSLLAAPASAQNGSTQNGVPRNGAAINGRSALSLSAEAVLLLDHQGRVLYEKRAAEDHAPASLVKLMTLYLACEAIHAGRAQWDEPVTVSRRAADTPRYRMGLRAGEQVSLRTLLEGVAIASANDAATAVAEHLGGSEEAFVALMNAKGEELGLAATRFANAHGLPDPQQRSTAEDLARLTVQLLEDYPLARALLGGAAFVYRGKVYSRHIPLFHDPTGVQALKTGFTREAGYNLAVGAWHGGEQFVLIILGAQTRSLSFRDARAVLEFGFHEVGITLPAHDHRRPALPRRPGARPRGARGSS